ncbi:MAG: hypothetical protein P4K86_01155 [Terracidiphilus sp.]|nr:hypothetical protein [Terracidiphilus sp.]
MAVELSESNSKVNIHGIEELVTGKCYLSDTVLKRVKSYGVRSDIQEKPQVAHVSAFNLSLVIRQLLGSGTPRELK